MKTVSERIFENEHPIMEMAMVSDPDDQLPMKTKICVFGGEGQENSQKEPHFHVIINNGEREFEVFIKNIDDLEIWWVKGNHPRTWTGYTNVKKAIEKWLNEKSKNFPPYTNRESIVRMWNGNNPSNKISLAFFEALGIPNRDL